MDDAERYATVAAGAVGLALFAGGALRAAVPPVDRAIQEVLADLARRRTAILAGSVLSVTGAALLLWPLAAVATAGDTDVWPSLAVLSVAVAVLGFAFLAVAALAVAAVAWRDPAGADPGPARLLLDAAHLATWSVSAPVGAVSVVATTAVGLQADLVGPLVVLAAGAKVATVAVELSGTGRRRGWNAGGWAAGSSGYATVAWFAALLLALW